MTTKVTASVLANTGVAAGTYGTSSTVPIITIDAQGRITSATAATVSGAGAGVGATTYTVTKFTATAGQTVFTVNYTVGYVQVYLNGVLLDYATDFTASNGTSITLATAAALDDIITVYAYSVSSVANITGGAAGQVLYQSAANTTSNTDVGTSGQLLVSGGSGKPVWIAQTALSIANTQITGLITGPQIAPSAIPAGGFSNMTVFTSPGTFNIPPSTTKLKVTVIGGGAGGPGFAGSNSSFLGGPGGAGASGSATSFGSYQTATGGTVPASGTAPGADLIIDGAYFGKYGSSGNAPTFAAASSSFSGMGGYGIKILSAPFPVTSVPVTIGIGGGGGGGGGGSGNGPVPAPSLAGSAASGATGGAGGIGGPFGGCPSSGAGGGGGGGGGASGSTVGTGGAAGPKGPGGNPASTPGAAGTPGTGPFNRMGGGNGGSAGIGVNCAAQGGVGGTAGHSGIVIVEF